MAGKTNDNGPIRRVGYIGLGIMGAPMAANLLKAGFEVHVWNRTASKAEPLTDAGAEAAESPAELARRGLDAICLNVTDTPDVEAVLFGDDGLADAAQAGLIVIDHSTISPEATKDFAARLGERGVTLVDAPVSGGDTGAKAGTLSIMVGGPAETFERCRPLFEAVGKSITHVGEVGTGQLCKACNQVAVVNALMGVSEAIALARAGGLDVGKMIEVVSAGAGGSWQMQNLGPKIAAEDFAPGFMIDLVLKDLSIVLENAEQHGLSLDGTAVARRYFSEVADDGGGKLGTQAMARAVGGER